MSGGSYEYLSFKVDDAATQVKRRCRGTPSLNAAFGKHLKLVADALHAIEWNDSGDGHPDEEKLIRACLPADAELKAAIELAEASRAMLDMAISHALKGLDGQ